MLIEIFRRLTQRPLLFVEILAASFFIALLNLTFPLFSIQLFNRYLGHGHDGTLLALTGGVLIALFSLHGLTLVRGRMLAAVNKLPERANVLVVMDALLGARFIALEQTRPPASEVAVESLGRMENATSPATMATLFDFPFSLLYLGAVFLLHPLLGWIGTIFLLLGVGAGLWEAVRALRDGEKLLPLEQARKRFLFESAAGSRTVRVFSGNEFTKKRWQRLTEILFSKRVAFGHSRDQNRALQTTLAMGMYIFLYAAGGVLVVEGGLTIGALVGANILATRAFRNSSQFAGACLHLFRAHKARGRLEGLLHLPRDAENGTAMCSFSGRIVFRNVSFSYIGDGSPVFEGLDAEIAPGTLVLVSGRNGAGKTTLAMVLAGLLAPRHGEVLADGVSLAQMALPWWRSQFIYLPQEPFLLEGSIRDNIVLGRPGIDEQAISRAVSRAGLREFLDHSPQGIATPVKFGGQQFSTGIRKRITLARALVTDGKLVIFDEPFEHMDGDGRKAIAAVIRDCADQGKTIILLASNPGNMNGIGMILDLDAKPSPRIIRCDAGDPFHLD